MGYLPKASGPVPLVLDLRISHDRFGSSSDPSLNGNLHYPNDIDRSLNESDADKIRKYHSDYNNNPPRLAPNAISFMPVIVSTSGSAIKLGVIVLPLSPIGVLFDAEIKKWQHPGQGSSFTY